VKQTELDDIGVVAALGGSGGPQPRCMWGESVCGESPDRYIVFAASDEGGSVGTYCGRHYVLTLAYQVEVHLPHCLHGGDVADHIVRWGLL
jgi:hypothetical protein